MGLSIVTLALARKAAKKSIDQAVAQAILTCKSYTDTELAKIVSFEISIVEELPSLSEADPHKIYFISRTTPSGETDFYYEYMIINNKWELIGSTELDLSGYWTIQQVKDYVESKKYTLPAATTEQLGGVKIDNNSIKITNDGIIYVDDSYISDVSGDKTQEIIDQNFSKVSNEDISKLFQ